jgi:hypothetical protein
MTIHKHRDRYAYRNKLPFVAKAKSGGEFWWNVTPSWQYEADYQTGRAYAVAFWRNMRRQTDLRPRMYGVPPCRPEVIRSHSRVQLCARFAELL